MTVTRESSEAGRRFPELGERAGHGQTTIITHEGKVCAVLTPPPMSAVESPSILELRGSGRGFWGPDVEWTTRTLRDEWTQNSSAGSPRPAPADAPWNAPLAGGRDAARQPFVRFWPEP
jgi:hypothetical protein